MGLTVALVNPQIPQNTGSTARLTAATNSELHLIGKMGFEITDSAVKRAGLDYWHLVNWKRFEDIENYFEGLDPASVFLVTTKGTTCYADATFSPNSTLVFGAETVGLPPWLMEKYADRWITIPMLNREAGMRSLNLATSVGIVLYEAIRQVGF